MQVSRQGSPGEEKCRSGPLESERVRRLYRRTVHEIERKLKLGGVPKTEETAFARTMIRCETWMLRRDPSLSALALADALANLLLQTWSAGQSDAAPPLQALIDEHLKATRRLLDSEC